MAGQPKTREKRKKEYQKKRRAAEIEAKRIIETDIKAVSKRPVGRPKVYNNDTFEKVLEHIRQGKSLVRICLMDGMPHYETVLNWMRNDRELSVKYARAREDQADFFADRLVELAENTPAERDEIEKARLISDNIKWTAAKLKPKKYGDKLDLTSDGEALPTPITALQVNMPAGTQALPPGEAPKK